MPDIKLDHCVIHVSNWEHSNAFYRDVLGAELVKIGSGWSYRFGDTQLNCHGPNVEGMPVAKLPVMPGGADLCFVWRGPIDAAIQHLNQHHIRVEVGPVERFGSQGYGTSVYFRDPDGHSLEFIALLDDPPDPGFIGPLSAWRRAG